MSSSLFKMFLFVSVLGNILATQVNHSSLEIQHNPFPTEVMMKMYGYEDLRFKDMVSLALTSKAFYAALTSLDARNAFWKMITEGCEFANYRKRLKLIRFLGVTEYEKEQFRKMELTRLFGYCRHLALASRWKSDDLTDSVVSILAERLDERGNINILLPENGPIYKRRQPCNLFVNESLVIAMFENARWLPSFALIPCRLNFSRARLMYGLLGWRYVWRFIEPIPMWAGILAYVASLFRLLPLSYLDSTPGFSFSVLFMFSLTKQIARLFRFILNF